MSYFVIGVGGTGAKMMQTLIHLGAAGLLPDANRALDGLLVDPDEANGNVDECQRLFKSYSACHALQTGRSALFNQTITLRGPWSPIERPEVDTLNKIFEYTQMRMNAPVEADLMELLFDPVEREMAIHQGFRGRPAIGATVLGNAVSFLDEKDEWFKLSERLRAHAGHGGLPLLLAGSVFGGSGAAGVPTIFRLLKGQLGGTLDTLRLGLVLFLPYFRFTQIPGEEVQADPFAFSTATAEALKYYHERGFLEMCDSIYTVGEQIPAEMAVSAVGAGEQRNEPHFLELVAGLGAVRFFGGGDGPDREHTLSIAARAAENTVRWDDLPAAIGLHAGQMLKLQKMAAFAVAFHYLFYPHSKEELAKPKTRVPFLQHHIHEKQVPLETAQADLARVDDYVTRFLTWLLRISTPRREGWQPGLVNPNVFATRVGQEWQLKPVKDFKTKEFEDLFLNLPGKARPNLEQMYKQAEAAVDDGGATGTGRLIRALYDSCDV